jgi:hypothetical protein
VLFNNESFIEIGKDIYVYKNFLTSEECDQYTSFAKSIADDKWKSSNGQIYIAEKIFYVRPIPGKIRRVVPEELKLAMGCQIIRLSEGAKYEVHSDSNIYADVIKRHSEYKDGDEFEIDLYPLYGIVVYLNDFEGGELYYPNQNIEYKPSRGDLVIHSADEHCAHGTRPVTSGTRYTYTSSVAKEVKVAKNVI